MIAALQPAAQAKNDKSEPRGTRLITASELARVDMLTIRYRRHWRFEFIAENVRRCQAADRFYTLLVVGGDVKDPTRTDYRQSLEALIDKLGAEYSDDPLCWGVHTAVPPYNHSEELFWGRPMPRSAINVNLAIMSQWRWCFPNQKQILAGSANDPNAMKELIAHGMGLGDFVYKINSLSAKTATTGWAGTDLLVHTAKVGGDIGFEMLCGSNEKRFGGTWAKAMTKQAAIEKRAGKKAVYLAKYKADIK